MNSVNFTSDLEQTIHAMEKCHICADPHHYHSFQQVNFLLSLRKCAGCDGRLQAVLVFGSNDASQQVVRCLACGVFAHRRCAMGGRTMPWKQVCPVNVARLRSSSSRSSCRETNDDSNELDVVSVGDGTLSLESPSNNKMENSGSAEQAAPALKTPPPAGATPDPVPLEWTMDGPPQHFAANAQFMGNFVQTITIPAVSTDTGGADSDDDEEVHISPLHYANRPFASVSRALQDNILAHFRPKEGTQTAEEEKGTESTSGSTTNATNTEDDIIRALETRREPIVPHPPPSVASQEQHPIVKFASGTYEAVRSTVNMPARIGMASVCGGVVGTVAGLAIAGPVGAMTGYQLGRTAGALGVILEGSLSIGVFVASVATASYTANKIQEEIQERRILTMGEKGISRRVLLVRPNVHVDPVWDQICLDAKRSMPKELGVGPFLLLPTGDSSRRERSRRDADIIGPTEDEIPTTDKVLLLVSRILNDKSSLPGHVYRSLIQTFRQRCEERQIVLRTNSSVSGLSARGRRDDAHAVIKHVTATLLEIRPGFGSSPTITELTATAVEGLVFGELYDLVFEEIVKEAAELDAALCRKISDFESRSNTIFNVSEKALEALRLLPGDHSAVDKLNHCVVFLEKISEHFSSDGSSLCAADSLLKMVCQHILKVANLELHINAQVAFLEEFARDEQ